MKFLKKYGKLVAYLLMGAGLLLTLYAWYITPKSFRAEIWVSGTDEKVQVEVSDLIAANWLMDAGIRLYPGDTIIYSGVEIDPGFHLSRPNRARP